MRDGRVRSEQGAALVFALAVMLLVALAAQAALAVLAYEARAAATGKDATAAFQLAEAGLERAVFELRRDPDWTDRGAATAATDPLRTGWAPVCLDPGADGSCASPADSVPFPAADPLGRFTVRVKRRVGPECGPEGCLCLRSTGVAANAVRRVEAVLTRAERAGPVRVVAWREVLAEHDPMACENG